jgi:membrane protease subunit HflC
MRTFFAAVLLLLGAAAAAAYASLFIVHQNQQAIVLRFGDPRNIITTPGLNWKIPGVETVEYFDKRILDLDTAPQEVTVSDQKRLVVDAFTRYRITQPLKFYQTVRSTQNVRSTLGPIVDSSMRRVLGNATFADVVRDKREDLMKRIARQVNEEGKEFGIEVVDVRIKRADLPRPNSQSVFARMKAEREREAAEFRAEGAAGANRIRATADREVTVLTAEATRKSELQRGEGDGERNRIFADAFGKDDDSRDFFAFYRSMQAYDSSMAANKGTRMLLSPDSEFFRYFNNPLGQPGQARK